MLEFIRGMQIHGSRASARFGKKGSLAMYMHMQLTRHLRPSCMRVGGGTCIVAERTAPRRRNMSERGGERHLEV